MPELPGAARARALLPGPFTLVLAEPGAALPWLGEPETIGVRVPRLPAPPQAVLAQIGAVAATSANLHGGPDPRTLDDVPAEIRDACGAVVDGGELPGVPSTVLDLTGAEPRVAPRGRRARAPRRSSARVRPLV